MLHSIDLADEELIEVLRQEWLGGYAPLDFRHPNYIDWEEFCLLNGITQEQINYNEEHNHGQFC